MKSVLKDWVMELGLRHQGVLIAAIRGCDTAPKNDPSKLLTRCLRERILNCHCGDVSKAVSFIERVSTSDLLERMHAFRKNLDHYPHHYVMHFIHAVGVIAYHGEVDNQLPCWIALYGKLCMGLHMTCESKAQMDERLNADEETFGQTQAA